MALILFSVLGSQLQGDKETRRRGDKEKAPAK
jgi:hypothetical protein